VARLCGETTAVQRTVVWYRAMVINLVCGLVSAVCLGFSFYGTVRLSLYLETVGQAVAAGSLMHGLTGLTVASFVVCMVGIYVSFALYSRYGEFRGGGLRPFALAYVACAACVALTVGAAFYVVSALLLPHIAQTRVRPLHHDTRGRIFIRRGYFFLHPSLPSSCPFISPSPPYPMIQLEGMGKRCTLPPTDPGVDGQQTIFYEFRA